METDFASFHDDVQFSTNSLLSSDEMMKDQLGILESIKNEGENVLWAEESVMNDEAAVGKEDFQQIMSDWQNHVSSLQISESEDVDVPLDLLNASDIMFDERRSPILSKGMNYLVPKLENVMQPTPELLGMMKKDGVFEGDSCESYPRAQSEPRFYHGRAKSEPTVVRKLTLLNGEKEILGKNIIGLHSLNEIKENPDQNCQVTSTVINGKRYKIIIKPKSQKVKKFAEEKIRKTLIKKLSRCNNNNNNSNSNAEPKEDEIISEMCNGNYDVPILGNDTLLNWDMTWFDSGSSSAWDYNVESGLGEARAESDAEPPKKVPPLKIKIPKMKKGKKKKAIVKSDEEIDVETVAEKGGGGDAKTEKSPRPPQAKEREEHANEVIKNSLPREVVDHIESLKRKKDGRIPLVQVIPTRKHVRSGTRMQDAAATINRNKLLKIVSGGDTVQLDHDYCSNTFKSVEMPQKKIGNSDSEANLTEKNPKKDSGMESGDVSDASEEPQTPESVTNAQSIHHINNKLLQERRSGKASSITKVAAAFFRAANVITSNVNNSDIVKTLVVSNGTKALTNDSPNSSTLRCKPISDKSDIVPSGSSEICNSGDGGKKTSEEAVGGGGGGVGGVGGVGGSGGGGGGGVVGEEKSSNVSCSGSGSEQAQQQISQIECPKKKLKLEEYLSRRNGRGGGGGGGVDAKKDSSQRERKEEVAVSSCSAAPVSAANEAEAAEKPDPEKATEAKQEKKDEKEDGGGKAEESGGERSRRGSSGGGSGGGRKSRQYRSQRSSSTSSGERDGRRERERSSRSRSSWKRSRRESRSRHKYRASTSSERRRSFWSRSLSRSSSRESSSSSDRSAGRRKRTASPVWYRRRSRSRSISRERSRSRNRSYSNRRRQNRYFNRNFYNRRSRSPYHSYSMREKQRQIEERRVIYIGRIEEGMTNAKLRERFSVFGPIVDISLHFREYGDNYGFVTYAYKDDAYDAVEHGNDNPNLPRYDLCFGGRRGFCKERYADLDGMPTSYSGFKDTPILRSYEESFDLLLKKAQAKLKKRISKGGKT